jgi:hypothetical protein
MSNQVEKFGLRPYRKLDGTPLVGAQNRYTIASNYATAIYQGDMVEPLASDITAFIVDDPDAVFLMDADATFARADLFKNYSVTNTTGVTQTGMSKAQLDVSVSGVASTFAVQAIDISQDPENSDTSSANANILVRINNHFYRSGTGL